MKNSLVFLIFVLLIAGLSSCSKNGGSEPKPEPADRYEFFSNPDDPYFLKVKNEDGSEAFFSGDKDAKGNLLNITGIKITKGAVDYHIDYENGRAVRFYDNDNNTIVIDYNDAESAIASFIGKNSETVYHFKVARKNTGDNRSRSFVSGGTRATNDGYYYLRYRIKLEYADIAPNAKFSTNYYTHKVVIYNDDIRLEKNAELVGIENNYATYQLKLNPGYENEPIQNDIAAGMTWVLDALDIQKMPLGDLASEIATAYAGKKYDIPDAILFAMGDMVAGFINSLAEVEIDVYDLPKAIRTDRKIGDGFKIMVSANGTGVNRQLQWNEIKYTDLKQQQDKDIHFEVVLKDIFPFEERFMYAPPEKEPEEKGFFAGTRFNNTSWRIDNFTYTYNHSWTSRRSEPHYSGNGSVRYTYYTENNSISETDTEQYYFSMKGNTLYLYNRELVTIDGDNLRIVLDGGTATIKNGSTVYDEGVYMTFLLTKQSPRYFTFRIDDEYTDEYNYGGNKWHKERTVGKEIFTFEITSDNRLRFSREFSDTTTDLGYGSEWTGAISGKATQKGTGYGVLVSEVPDFPNHDDTKAANPAKPKGTRVFGRHF